MAQFERILVSAILDEAYSRALIPVMRASGQLAAGMRKIMIADETGALFIPHYWAVHVHDGRGPAYRPKGSGKPPFIWFKNPLLDPRLRNGSTPRRVSQLRHLTPSQFHAARRRGELVITRSIGPVAPTPFFSNAAPDGGMFGFALTAEEVGKPFFRRFVREQLEDVLDMEIRAQW